jgi:hypothetical protein
MKIIVQFLLFGGILALQLLEVTAGNVADAATGKAHRLQVTMYTPLWNKYHLFEQYLFRANSRVFTPVTTS